MRQIIALGGGGFSDEPENTLLDQYILTQSSRPKPNVCFIASAGGDSPDYIERFYKSYGQFNCIPAHITLTKTHLTGRNLENFLLSKDIIFIGGGSTIFLISLLKKTGADKILSMAWTQGIILSGMSAGAMCWFEEGFTNPEGDRFKKINCLGFLEGSFCPHYNVQGSLRESYKNLIIKKQIKSGYAVEDGAGLHFIDGELKCAVSSRLGASAYYVKKRYGKVFEKCLSVKFLGKTGGQECLSY